MRVASIAIYPVKACHRLEVERAEVEPWGLSGDRRWVVVDARTGVAVTQRDTTTLAQIHPTPTAGGVQLRMVGRPDLTVEVPYGVGTLAVTVWRNTIAARPAGPEADEWLSDVLDRPVRLMWLDDPTRRPVDPRYALVSDRVSFADGFPVSLANEASLAALNELIPEPAPVPITRFRSNIVVTGAQPWAEDAWTGGRIRVGEVVFRVAKPNDRCVVTTIDQETGQTGHEPLRTLGRHRNVDQELLFATYLIPDSLGCIAIGDPVTVM